MRTANKKLITTHHCTYFIFTILCACAVCAFADVGVGRRG